MHSTIFQSLKCPGWCHNRTLSFPLIDSIKYIILQQLENYLPTFKPKQNSETTHTRISQKTRKKLLKVFRVSGDHRRGNPIKVENIHKTSTETQVQYHPPVKFVFTLVISNRPSVRLFHRFAYISCTFADLKPNYFPIFDFV